MTEEHTMFELASDIKDKLSDVINPDDLTDVIEVVRQSENGAYHSGLGTVTIKKSRKRINVYVSFTGNTGSRRDSVSTSVDTILGVNDSLHKLKYHNDVIKYETKGHWDYLYEIEILVTK